LKRTLYPIADATISDGSYAASNFGGAPSLQLGTVVMIHNRIVLAFSLAEIPPQAVITSADLVLQRATGDVVAAPLTLTAQLLSANWTELGVTWNTRDGATPWAVPGGDISGEIRVRTTISPSETQVQFSDPLLVATPLAEGNDCLVRLTGPEVATNSYVNLHSRSAALAADWPRLEVEYHVPTPPADGPLMVPLDKLCDMLAATPATQARFGTTGVDAQARARARIYFPVLEEELIPQQLPAIVVTDGDDWSYRMHSGGAQNYLRPEGSALVLFAAGTRYPGNLEAGRRDFSNWVGATLRDLADLAGVDALLAIRQVEQEMPPAMCSKEHEDTYGLYFLASYLVSWS
jgi:hypothetical protein